MRTARTTLRFRCPENPSPDRRSLSRAWLWLLIAGCSSSSDGNDGSGGTMSSVGRPGGSGTPGTASTESGTGGGTASGSSGAGAGAGNGGMRAGGSGTGTGMGGTGAGTSGAGTGGTGAGAGGTGASCDASPQPSTGTPMIACNTLPGVCGDCIWEKCCVLSDLCTVDADCACMTMCIATASVAGTNGCLTTCGLTGSPPGFGELLACAASACSNAGGVGGECSVPAGFEPPPDSAPAAPMSSASIGSGTLADCSFGAPSASVLELENADGSVCVRIERRNDGPGSLANTRWTLISMLVGPLGEVALIDDPADMCWYSSHHNFNDWAHASTGSRHYEVKTSLAGHATMPTYKLYVFEDGLLDAASCAPTSDGACAIATIDLVPAQ